MKIGDATLFGDSPSSQRLLDDLWRGCWEAVGERKFRDFTYTQYRRRDLQEVSDLSNIVRDRSSRRSGNCQLTKIEYKIKAYSVMGRSIAKVTAS